MKKYFALFLCLLLLAPVFGSSEGWLPLSTSGQAETVLLVEEDEEETAQNPTELEEAAIDEESQEPVEDDAKLDEDLLLLWDALLPALIERDLLPLDFVDLYEGMEGARVFQLQLRLYHLGYYGGEIHGEYEENTRKAMAQFENISGLPIDGRASVLDQLKLYEKAAKPNPTLSYLPQTEASSPTENKAQSLEDKLSEILGKPAAKENKEGSLLDRLKKESSENSDTEGGSLLDKLRKNIGK